MVLSMLKSLDKPNNAMLAAGQEYREFWQGQMLQLLTDSVNDFVKTVVVVAEKDGQVIGGMVGDTVKPIWSEDLIGLDFGFYIKPEHRGHNYAAQMVKAFEVWCFEMGAKQVRPAVSTANAAAGRLYKGLGYKPVGEQFMREP
jgi:RimJ/RimL family protein N-acetyltransferase